MFNPEEVAKEILSVQPMGAAAAALKQLYENALSEEELVTQGYEPVCPTTKILWIKRVDK